MTPAAALAALADFLDPARAFSPSADLALSRDFRTITAARAFRRHLRWEGIPASLRECRGPFRGLWSVIWPA